MDIEIHLPHESPPRSARSLADRHLVVQRGLRDHTLRVLLELESDGTRCCNPIASTLATSDRLTVIEELARAGIDVPETRLVGTWGDVVDASAAAAIVVKSRSGVAGRGSAVAVVADGGLPGTPVSPAPWLLQELVPGDGHVRKLYVVGDHVRGLLKKSGTDNDVPGSRSHEVFRPPVRLAELARRAGAALGLDIYGVDVIVGPDGPRIIDVNPSPGFRGISDAATLVARHLRDLVSIVERS